MKKRGLSPVIATVLLISLSLVLAVGIFVWANAFIGEQALKNNSPIEDSCGDIDFEAEYLNGRIDIVNRGNVPLHGISVRESGFGSVIETGIFDDVTITSGQTGSIKTGTLSGNVIVVPIILGESGRDTKSFTCDDSYGLTIAAA